MSYVNMDLELDGMKQRIKKLEEDLTACELDAEVTAHILATNSKAYDELIERIKNLETQTNSPVLRSHGEGVGGKPDSSKETLKKVRNEHEAARYAAKKF